MPDQCRPTVHPKRWQFHGGTGGVTLGFPPAHSQHPFPTAASQRGLAHRAPGASLELPTRAKGAPSSAPAVHTLWSVSPSVKCYYFPCAFNSNILSRQWKPGPTQAWPVSRRNRRSLALCVAQGFFLPLSICRGGPRGCGERSPELSPWGVAERAQDPKLHRPPCLNG